MVGHVVLALITVAMLLAVRWAMRLNSVDRKVKNSVLTALLFALTTVFEPRLDQSLYERKPVGAQDLSGGKPPEPSRWKGLALRRPAAVAGRYRIKER